MNAKPVKRVDLSKLNPDERAAVMQFIRDAKQAAPHMKTMQNTAQQVFREWLKTPKWDVTDGQREDLWHVGAPEVNYVDHIEGT